MFTPLTPRASDFASQIITRNHDSDAAERMQVEQILVARHDHVRSMTTRSRVIVGEQCLQARFGEPVGDGLRRDLIPEIEKRLNVFG